MKRKLPATAFEITATESTVGRGGLIFWRESTRPRRRPPPFRPGTSPEVPSFTPGVPREFTEAGVYLFYRERQLIKKSGGGAHSENPVFSGLGTRQGERIKNLGTEFEFPFLYGRDLFSGRGFKLTQYRLTVSGHARALTEPAARNRGAVQETRPPLPTIDHSANVY
jgi:hypothetical protein